MTWQFAIDLFQSLGIGILAYGIFYLSRAMKAQYVMMQDSMKMFRLLGEHLFPEEPWHLNGREENDEGE